MLFILSVNSGCRTARDNQIDLLERELRAQEDYIYQLEDYVAEYSQKLRQARVTSSKTVILKQDSLPTPAKPSNSSSTGRPPARLQSSREEREQRMEQERTFELPNVEEEIPDPAPFDPEELEAPELDLEIGEPIGDLNLEDPANRLASTLVGAVERVSSRDDAFANAGESAMSLADSESSYSENSIEDDTLVDESEFEHPHELTLESVTDLPPTPGYDEFDQMLADEAQPLPGRQAQQVLITQLFRGGEEGDTQLSSFLSVVEARDASDLPADFDGAVSVMIMTTDKEKPQRIKRWDFTAEETAAAWQASHLGEGLHLELPLAEASLPDEPIEMWVRLVTGDGRKLLAELPFDAANLTTLDEASEMGPTNDTRLATAESVTTTSGEEVINPLRAGRTTEKGTPTQGTSSEETNSEKPRWRAASQHADPTLSPSSSAKGKQWTAQSFSRSESKPTAVASREQLDAEPPRIRIPTSGEWKTSPVH